MLDKIMGNEGMVKEICRDGKKVWSMPECQIIDVEGIGAGSGQISITGYPDTASYKIEYSGITISGELGFTGRATVNPDKKLASGDYVSISLSNPGFVTDYQGHRVL